MQKEFLKNTNNIKQKVVLTISLIIILITSGCYSQKTVLDKKVTIYALPLSASTQINIEKSDIRKISTIKINIYEYSIINNIINQSKEIEKKMTFGEDYLVDVRLLCIIKTSNYHKKIYIDSRQNIIVSNDLYQYNEKFINLMLDNLPESYHPLSVK